MKISQYNKDIGNNVKLINYNEINKYDKIYLSKVFDFTKIPIDIDKCKNIEYGGTGFYFDNAPDLQKDIEHHMPDYNLYNEYVNNKILSGDRKSKWDYYSDYSLGFMTRGCFRKCSFCVNKKYDKVHLHSPLKEFLDLDKKYICLLDDNILASQNWESVLNELIDIDKSFQFKQGLDIRLLTNEKAKILSKCRYKDYYIFAFDNIKDREIIEEKLLLWRKHTNIKIKSYVLVAHYSQDVNDIIGTFERIKILMKYKCLPYIMRYKDYKNSEMYGIYVNLSSWCNQPNLFENMSFREWCIRDNERKGGNSATIRYLNDFEKKYPDVAKKYFDLEYKKLNIYI